MNGPWFVGKQYLHVQAWEVDFHSHIAKISTTAIWICLEQLHIKYYHLEFLKHVGNKLGKLLKVDAITRAAIRGRYAQMCVQINIANPLLKRVKIGSFWQDIVYENLPMLCYWRGRIGHRDIHCSEGTSKSPTTSPIETDPRGDQGSSAPTQETTPWKTVHTRRRARARGPPPETSTRGKMYQRDAHTPVKPRVQTVPPQVHVMRTPLTGSMIGQELDGSKKLSRIHRNEVASHSKNMVLLQPRELASDFMQASCMNTCSSDDLITPSSQAMQFLEKTNTALHSAPTQPQHLLNDASLIGPKLLDSHSDRPWLASNSYSPKHPDPPCHTHHEHTSNFPPRPSTGDSEPRANMEQPIFGTFQRRDGDLCPDTSSPADCTSMEPGDADPKSANAARTTTPTYSLPYAKDSCLSAPLRAPIPSPNGTFLSPTKMRAEQSRELLQCGLSRPTACSHFPLPGSRRNKHITEGRWTQLIHNHVLKPKPTICRVRHALGQAQWSGTNLSHSDHHSEASVSSSICSEDPDDRGSPEWLSQS